jgi:MSHA pilin protein MshC
MTIGLIDSPPLGPRRLLGCASGGYTMVELVVVMTVVGVLAASLGPRFFTQSVFSDRGYADELAAALRFAEKAAVMSGCGARLSLSTSGYVVTQQAGSGNACLTSDTTWSTPVLQPDGSAVAGTASTTVASPTGLYTFNDQGQLTSGPGGAVSGVTTLTVGSRAITIDPVTGAVEVQ